MLVYPDFQPVAFSLGPMTVHWYGISYLVGFIGCYWLSRLRASRFGYSSSEVGDMLFYIALGIIFGGRIGYILFYEPSLLFAKPWSILAIWEPGRSFHGGMLGVLVALLYYQRFQLQNFIRVTDFVAPAVPIGLGCGRFGNFINGELYGRITDVPWGMVFTHIGPEPRHPSQLYEFILEGVVLCVLLLAYASKPRKLGQVSGMFLLGYGLFRCVVELVREPDHTLGFILGNYLTMGQLLSIPMIILGSYFILRERV